MLVSDLIERLEQLLATHGDLDVWVDARYATERAGPVTTADFDTIETEDHAGGSCIAIITD